MLKLLPAGSGDIDKEALFISGMPADENGLTNTWPGISIEEYRNTVLPEMLRHAQGLNLPDWMVPETFLFLWDDGTIVGQFRLRHYLNDALRNGSGHIGQFIAKEERGKGYGTKGLSLTLEYGRAIIPEDEFYLRVNTDNPASLKVMLKNGGRVVGESDGHFFVRIPKTNLRDCYLEEDLFPKLFTLYEERPYGILFYNPENRDSYDSNHAVIYRDRIDDLQAVLQDIVQFYKAKGSNAIIYQSMLDDCWFGAIKDELAAAGFDSWTEEQRYMLPLAENTIKPAEHIDIRMADAWSDDLKQVFLDAEEPWEIAVLEKSITNENYWCFTAYIGDKPVGLLYGHKGENVCRVDYMLVSKKARGQGAGRALFNAYVNWAKAEGIADAYIWPDGETPERIYREGGFRLVEVRTAGRAVYRKTV